MKLIQIINSRLLLASLIIMMLLSFSLAIVLYFTINEQVEENMEHSFRSIKKQIANGNTPGSFSPYFEIDTINQLNDTLFFNETMVKGYKEKHSEKYKQLNAVITINGISYKIEIRESLLETDDFIENIVSVVLISIFIMLATLYLINRKIAQTIWSGFYYNLEKIKAYTLQKPEPILLKKTDITEFDELNEVLEHLTYQVSIDYKNLKQFSEDASHELQTPLAIIRSKLEALLNANKLSAEQTEKIQAIYQTTNRLTRLNKDLLLLTKLDNMQYDTEKQILLNQVIAKKIDNWQEIIALKNLTCKLNTDSDFIVTMNSNLADILISNLMSNAINHNIEQGAILIEIKENKIRFSNNGEKPLNNTDKIFNRFYKEKHTPNSVGLGLAIAKKICDTYQIKLEYSFENKQHIFTLTLTL